MDGDLAISTESYGEAAPGEELAVTAPALLPDTPEPMLDAPAADDEPGDATASAGVPAIVFGAEDAPADERAAAARPSGPSAEPEAVAATVDEAEAPAEDLARLESLLESLLLAAGSPVPLARLVDVVDGPPRRDVVAALRALGERYEGEGRGLRLVHVGGGWQLRSAPEHGPFVRKLLGGRPPRLSRAMLETLAIVAYRQPCTKPEIEAIRGVDADATLNTLLERRMVRITGRKEAPGRPLLYATTREFLEVFGLPDLHALPPLAELGSGADLLASPDLTVGPAGVHPTPAAELGFVAGRVGTHGATAAAALVADPPADPTTATEEPGVIAEPSDAERGPDGDGTAG